MEDKLTISKLAGLVLLLGSIGPILAAIVWLVLYLISGGTIWSNWGVEFRDVVYATWGLLGLMYLATIGAGLWNSK